jgi:ankyrin repeat protein
VNNMKYIFSFMVVCTPLCIQNMQLIAHKDIMHYMVPFLDFSDASSFFWTCKAAYNLYNNDEKKINPIDMYFVNNQEKISLLTPYQHNHFLIHCAKQNNEKMFSFCMRNENDIQNRFRQDILYFFKYSRDESNIAQNMRAYRGIGKDQKKLDNRDIWYAKKVFELEVLLKNGADINTTDQYGQTVLHIAVMTQASHLVQLFCSRGVNIDIKDSYGDTALDYAARYNYRYVMYLLVEYGADLRAPYFQRIKLSIPKRTWWRVWRKRRAFFKAKKESLCNNSR